MWKLRVKTYEIDDDGNSVPVVEHIFYGKTQAEVANGNSDVGTHWVICWRPRVPQTITPGPGRWEFIGTGYDDLSLVAGSSSILLQGGCHWHGFVNNGEVTNA